MNSLGQNPPFLQPNSELEDLKKKLVQALQISVKLRIRTRHLTWRLAELTEESGLVLEPSDFVKQLLDEVRGRGNEFGADSPLLNDVLSAVLADLTCRETTPQSPLKTLRENLFELTASVVDRFDLHFDDDYFATHEYQNYEMEHIAKVATEQQDRSLALDLGCGTARVGRMLSLKYRFTRVVCVDVSPDMIAFGQRSHRDLREAIAFVERDLDYGIPADASTASLVIMNLGTASEIQNVRVLLNEIRRVLKPGGTAVLSFYNKESLVHKSAIIPWGLSLAAEVDASRDCLDVHWSGKVYSIFGRAYTVDEILDFIPAGLTSRGYHTYPTVGSIIPTEIVHERNGLNEIGERVKEIDSELSPLNLGHYILVELQKVVE